MGNLLELSSVDVRAILQILDDLDLTSRDIESFQDSSTLKRRQMLTRLIQRDQFPWAILEMEQTAKRVGFSVDDFLFVAHDEELLPLILRIIRLFAECKKEASP